MSNRKYKLLILQGGGYYGLIDITFLSYLGKDYDVLKDIKSMSGCSIGGIQAVALMAGAKPYQIQNLFLQDGAQIFKRRNNNILDIPWYSDEGLSKSLSKLVGQKTVKDVTKDVSFFVPVTNLSKNKLKVYDNVTQQDNDKKLLDIGLQTAAAMFYFPIRNINNDAITDGGIREVCPVMTHAIGLKNKLGIDFKDMDVFVICAGQDLRKNFGDYETINNWGAIDWLTKFIITDITNSNECTSKFWGQNIGFNSFTWFNPVQIYGSMDDVSQTDYILSQCEMYKELFLDKWNKFIS